MSCFVNFCLLLINLFYVKAHGILAYILGFGGILMVSDDLLEILRCPACVQHAEGNLELKQDNWLICTEDGCGRKYPIRDDIPVMLIDEGDKWVEVSVDDLPTSPSKD